MALYDKIISGSVAAGKGLFSGLTSFARYSPGAFFITGGAIAGAASSIYQGDNYSSTAFLRNAISGAVVGGGMGLMGRGLFTRTAARGAGKFFGRGGSFRASPAGKMLGMSSGVTRGAIGGVAGIGGMLARNPQIGFAGAIVGGGIYSLGGSFTTERQLSSGFSTEGRQVDQLTSNRDFANSASGLVFGLNSRRHR